MPLLISGVTNTATVTETLSGYSKYLVVAGEMSSSKYATITGGTNTTLLTTAVPASGGSNLAFYTTSGGTLTISSSATRGIAAFVINGNTPALIHNYAVTASQSIALSGYSKYFIVIGHTGTVATTLTGGTNTINIGHLICNSETNGSKLLFYLSDGGTVTTNIPTNSYIRHVVVFGM